FDDVGILQGVSVFPRPSLPPVLRALGWPGRADGCSQVLQILEGLRERAHGRAGKVGQGIAVFDQPALYDVRGIVPGHGASPLVKTKPAAGVCPVPASRLWVARMIVVRSCLGFFEDRTSAPSETLARRNHRPPST